MPSYLHKFKSENLTIFNEEGVEQITIYEQQINQELK